MRTRERYCLIDWLALACCIALPVAFWFLVVVGLVWLDGVLKGVPVSPIAFLFIGFALGFVAAGTLAYSKHLDWKAAREASKSYQARWLDAMDVINGREPIPIKVQDH